MADQIQLRVHGPPTLPTLIYLPGLHGNWTLIPGFRKALAGRVRFVEATYPPTLTWSLENYAAAVESSLRQYDIHRGWLLSESFGSQVAWLMIARKNFGLDALVLAGGFVRHPMLWAVRLAERISGKISFSLLVKILFGYARVSRWRFRDSPETLQGINDFIARLNESERQAAKHRLHLVAGSDPCTIARSTQIPVYALTGFYDPVVPWFWVRRWLKKNCPALREYRVVYHTDHNVLGTGAEAAADQIIKWMSGSPAATSNLHG